MGKRRAAKIYQSSLISLGQLDELFFVRKRQAPARNKPLPRPQLGTELLSAARALTPIGLVSPLRSTITGNSPHVVFRVIVVPPLPWGVTLYGALSMFSWPPCLMTIRAWPVESCWRLSSLICSQAPSPDGSGGISGSLHPPKARARPVRPADRASFFAVTCKRVLLDFVGSPRLCQMVPGILRRRYQVRVPVTSQLGAFTYSCH